MLRQSAGGDTQRVKGVRVRLTGADLQSLINKR